ncbi:probable rRNA maturation factor [Treponema bryantii]|uniref:Endoribonuclease YbeY n=1 Tax=Treponema bryantii TaxID=163 RepID=A0A1H9AAJ2_9SPIR|nr:rRNA maturation RNase YbeY [Treponema bryantii]BDC93752.1 endoribonuclease YbeY [Treponema bryantii]SEP73453.1 probable rRNA maturation factor [Treponema bryantii]
MNRVYVAMQDGVDEPDWFNNVEPFVQKVLGELKFDGEEISMLMCDDTYMQELNKTYRNIDSTTDVLSFENDEEYEDEEGKWKCVGDIVISLDTLPVNADYFEESRNDELKRLIVHGLLHLNGMDHGEEHIEKGVAPQCEMLVLQEKVLEQLKDEKIIK